MQSSRFLLFLAAAPLLIAATSGCFMLTAPTPQPTPTPAPTPKAPFFEPAAGQSRGPGISQPLNKASDPILPDAFRVAGALAGDRVTIQSLDTVQAGTPPRPVLNLGAPDRVRLAGIVAPTTEPALSLAKKTIADWTAGRDVDVEQDGKYPSDLNGVRVVHVFYKGRKGPYEGQVLSLNRMLVRSGNAVVDLYSPTAFDTSQWLLDEAYARRHRLGFWKFGVAVQQRIPITKGQGTSTGTGARSSVSIVPTTPGGVPGTATGTATNGITSATTSTSTTTQTQTVSPGAPPVTPPVSAPSTANPVPSRD